MDYHAGEYDVVVIGAGHAGIEAALASARLGKQTLLITTNLDSVGNMPCNPSIGGTAKGQLVREIDALGGEMGRAADACGIQFRMLNRGKGPAVHSPRAQADRAAYKQYMKSVLEHCPHLRLRQDEAVDVETEDGAVCAVHCRGGARFQTRAVVVCTGTFLNGRIFIGEHSQASGPDGLAAACQLTGSLERLGLRFRRFKTGTPARVDARSIDFSQLEVQQGDQPPQPFSFDGEEEALYNDAVCYLTYTNTNTHEVIRRALARSPLYTGEIRGVGPRYCPSIEDKIVRFSTKERHQVFIEPCGKNSGEMYLQGLSTSLPEDVQLEFLRTIPGLQHVEIMRPGYAIEYDCLDPTQLEASLAVRGVAGLYAAGQICGTSGYEEAAGQGWLAGVNAARFLDGEEPVVLDRSDGYLGTLIDDIVTKGTNEPYRMMTSRSEYRLLLRQDNADQRLMPLGYRVGLVSKERLERMEEDYRQTAVEIERLSHTAAKGPALAKLLEERGSALVANGILLADLLRRPEISYDCLAPVDPERPPLSGKVREQVEIQIKYQGYIQREQRQVEEHKRLEERQLPPDLDYLHMETLRLEARQKLDQMRPRSLGQAARISGVSPSDIGALMILLAQRGGEQ
ncbi:MAG TPA: tRNA uridine-5-carboxymethylaminomethyl(34) synthesis enzyme MnmG [Firmicutes bacterium]|nr:tRNA uridine-5-carboxymethylaminomethyl(34) synthesis enzyme MnmG [Bacillota bacterium]